MLKENIQEVEKVLKEIEILKALKSDRIIKFFGCYWDEAELIIFTEFMSGSLYEKLGEHGLDEHSAVRYFIQAAEGLEFLHVQTKPPIIHRDIKCWHVNFSP